MSDLESLRAELARFTYRAGWNLTIDGSGNPRYGGVFTLTVDYETPDAHHPDRPVRVVARRTVPDLAIMVEDSFTVWLQSVLFDVELHESREWLRRDGVLVQDPHAQGNRL